jgi:hypothetical protein
MYKTNGGRAAPAHKFLVGGFSGRASRIKLLPFGDKTFGALQTSLRNPAVLDAGGRCSSQGKCSRAGPRHASQVGLAEAQHQGTKPTEIRDCSCQAPDPSGWDAPSRLLQQPSRQQPPSIFTCHVYPVASSPSLGYCQFTVK